MGNTDAEKEACEVYSVVSLSAWSPVSLRLFGAGHRLSLSGQNKLDSFALLNFCWLQPSRVELCHVSGCVGSEELARFLCAGEECVKVGGVEGACDYVLVIM